MMKKWFLASFLWFGSAMSFCQNRPPAEGCYNPCKPENYNGLACCIMPCEFYFPPCDCPRGADLNFRCIGNFGKTLASDKDYITLEFNARQFFNCYETYIDGKWNYFTNWRNAANLGVGVRSFDCYCIVGGANLYYDYRRGPCNQDFHQISGGFEVFHPCFNFYLNFYYPFQGCKCLDSNVFTFDGGFFANCQESLCSLGGVDLELDKTLFNWCNTRISVGVGAYFYDNTCQNGWFPGGRFRLIADICTNIYAECEATVDKYFGGRFIGRVGLNIPFPVFGASRKRSGCCSTWCPPLPQRRNNLIVLQKQTCWDWNFDDKRGIFNFHQCGSGSGCGLNPLVVDDNQLE
jgi:Inverse autotransporter, beta-domain